MSSHTPGPWAVITELRPTDEIVCDMMNSGYVAIIQGQKLGNWRDDANLISAAPDLLEALETLKREIILSDVDMNYIASHFQIHLDKATKAIARAKGES